MPITTQKVASQIIAAIVSMMDKQNSFAKARAYVMDNLDAGVACPCCGQFAKKYKRPLNATMAMWLIKFVLAYELSRNEWVYVNEGDLMTSRKGGGDFAKLLHWGMLIPKPNDDSTKRSSGYWKPTKKALDFVHQRIAVPSHVYLYNNQVRGWAATKVDIVEALNRKFNYAELMGFR